MCQFCVSEGLMTQEEFDGAVLAGDMTVMPVADRLAAGTPLDQIIAEENMVSLGLLFLLFGIAEGEPEGSENPKGDGE